MLTDQDDSDGDRKVPTRRRTSIVAMAVGGAVMPADLNGMPDGTVTDASGNDVTVQDVDTSPVQSLAAEEPTPEAEEAPQPNPVPESADSGNDTPAAVPVELHVSAAPADEIFEPDCIIRARGHSQAFYTSQNGFTHFSIYNMGPGYQAEVILTWKSPHGFPTYKRMIVQGRNKTEYYFEIFRGEKITITNHSDNAHVHVRISAD
jgi:hypothetical protein